MEIFNAASKQINATAAKPMETQGLEARQVEQSHTLQKAAKDSKIQNAQDKREIQQQLNDTVKNLNSQMESLETNISFGFNDKTESMYVSVLERSSGKLIRKIPTEEAMKLSEHFQEIIGMIFDKKG